jgi:tetratricopeptide (TPR) repeat protein
MDIKFIRRCSSLFVLLITCFCIQAHAGDAGDDTLEVKSLNRKAFNNRLTDASQTILQAKRALAMATRLNYLSGMAEANRELGIGFYYTNQPDSAIQCYLEAKKIYDGKHDKMGLSRVLNNIGNLYRETDFDRSIEYFQQAYDVAVELKSEDLIGTAELNLGTGYLSKKNFAKALDYYNKSGEIFDKIHNEVYIIQCLQNKGAIYRQLGQLDTAKTLLLEANKHAKEQGLNQTIAGIDVTLTWVFMGQKKYDEADKYWQEGFNYAKLIKNNVLEHDYKFIRYQMLLAKRDWKGALDNLREIYDLDSSKYSRNESAKLVLLNEQYKQNEKDQINQRIIEQNRYARTLFIASTIVAALLAVVIFLLVNNVNRKAKVNKHLTELNEQISEQKENLNQINHHLEEIIDERTKDLQVKNKKLADYSLHLSHQIRGPIATLKGLLNLERDKLIEQEECIKLMNKCVSDIDENIIDMSGMLHESSKTIVKPKA